MKLLLKIEELSFFILAIIALIYLNVDWWFYLLLFIGPDISMLGYIINKKAGAITYNLFHHKTVAVIIFITGFFSGSWLLQVIGIILFGHSSMDRIFGYGLKYFQSFQHTPLAIKN
ncbi:MAG: DUF4260 domain-containing protein [Chitinophagaceae bacterium]